MGDINKLPSLNQNKLEKSKLELLPNLDLPTKQPIENTPIQNTPVQNKPETQGFSLPAELQIFNKIATFSPTIISNVLKRFSTPKQEEAKQQLSDVSQQPEIEDKSSTPEQKIQKNTNEVVSLFTNFRNNVKHPTLNKDFASQSDLSKVGYIPKTVTKEDGTSYTQLKFQPTSFEDYNTYVKELETQYTLERDRIEKTYDKEAAKYLQSSDTPTVDWKENSKKLQEINKERDVKLKTLSDSWSSLKSHLGQRQIDAKEAHLEPLVNVDLEGKDVKQIKQSYEESNTYFKSLNNTSSTDRKRNAYETASEIENVGNLEKIIQSKDYLDTYEKTSPQLSSSNNIRKEESIYYGTRTNLIRNEKSLEQAVGQKNALEKSYTESKQKLDEALKNIADKGYTMDALTPESKKQLIDAQTQLEELSLAIKQANENVDLRKQYSKNLFSDVSSLKELINYKAEVNKLRELYVESPNIATAIEVGSDLTKGVFKKVGKSLDQLKVLKFSPDLAEQDKKDYLNKLRDYSEYTPKTQIEYEGKYQNLKDVSAVKIFDEEGDFAPKFHKQALLYQALNTTGESMYLVGGAGLLRGGASALTKNIIGKEIAIRGAVAEMGVGTTLLEDVALKGLKATQWAGNVSSLVPPTFLIFGSDLVDQELGKGLSTEDLSTVVTLRTLAESVSENLLLDNVKFVNDLIRGGKIRNYKDLMKSDSYRTLMDKTALQISGKKLTELEYKAFFDPKVLKQLISKERLQAFSNLTGEKLKPYGKALVKGGGVMVEESNEELAGNFMNMLIDHYAKSKNKDYTIDEEYTIQNQVNTFVQTMASMLPMGASQFVKTANEDIKDRDYNLYLAAYQVGMSPKIFQENLIEQYEESQRSKNPMSKDEFNARMSELDKYGKIYEQLGFTEEKTKENLAKEIKKINQELGKEPKGKILPTQDEVEKLAEFNLRATEFEAFKKATEKSQLENEFLSAKTDVEKEKIVEQIDKRVQEIEKLKDSRKEQSEKLKQLSEEQNKKNTEAYKEVKIALENNLEDLGSYLSSFEEVKTITEELNVLSQLKQHEDQEIKNLATSLYTELNNKLFQVNEKNEQNFDQLEQDFIESLPVNNEDIIKTEEGYIYNSETEQLLFPTLKDLKEYLTETETKQKNLSEIQELNNTLSPEEGVVFATNDNKFGIELPTTEVKEFNSIQELKDFINSQKQPEQENLDSYEKEITALYEAYNNSRKKKVTKEQWLNQKQNKKAISNLKKKYDIKEEEEVVETPVEIILPEKTDEQILEGNSLGNVDNLSSGNIIYENTRLINVATLVAYQSREFEEVEQDGISTINESVNNLNNEFLFMLSPDFKEGEKFDIVVKPIQQSEFIEQEKETLRNNTRFLTEQGISFEEISSDINNDENFKEIQIFTKDGKYVGTIHSLSYIRPSRVVEFLYDEYGNQINNLAPNYKQLKELRSKILSNPENVELTLSSKNMGYLSFRFSDGKTESLPIQESIQNKDVLNSIQVLSKDSKIRMGRFESVNEAKSGSTVVALPTPNGKIFALSLQKRKLKDLEVSTILDAISMHVEYHNELDKQGGKLKPFEDLAATIEDKTGFDILSPEGLKSYIQLFVYANSKTSDFKSGVNKEQMKDIPFIDIDITENGELRITFSNSRDFQIEVDEDGNVNDKLLGIYRYSLPQLKFGTEFQTFSNLLKEHLKNRRINHSTDKSEVKFKTPFVKKQNTTYSEVDNNEIELNGLKSEYKNYKEYLISTSESPILETKLPDGKYSYFQQPNIGFSISEKQQEEETSKEEVVKEIEVQPIAPPDVVTQQELEFKKEEYTPEISRQEEIENLQEISKQENITTDLDILNSLNNFDMPDFEDTKYQKQTQSNEGIVASEKTIRDLAAKIVDRIGISVKFESDRSKDYKGKIENNVAYVNLAYATLDTPIHEILGHPIIRAIKNKKHFDGSIDRYNDAMVEFEDKNPNATREEAIAYADRKVGNNQTHLYQNLLKELETGKGKEVLDRIKKDYTIKTEKRFSGTTIDNKESRKEKGYEYEEVTDDTGTYFRRYTPATYYTLEEQQEEAIVELLSLMVADKLDNVKDGKLISLLKRLLKEMKQFVRSLLNQKEVEIDKLPDNMTLGDLSDLLAYSNSKLILPGYEVEYTTPDNAKFKTYQEASNHISELAKSVEAVDLDNINVDINKKPKTINDVPNEFVLFESPWGETKIKKDGERWILTDGIEDNYKITELSEIEVLRYFNNYNKSNDLTTFIDKNKEYEQSKEIIEEWKKVNNIVYNPQEIYSRGQEFSSVVGAYSSFDVNLMMQNLLSHIEDNEKAGGKFAISAYTKPIDKQIGHLEGGGGKIKFKLYPQSQDILWAANTDVYSGSVWDASEKVNKDKKSELLGVSYTKYPSLRNVNSVQPNLAAIVDDLAHHHNELGIVLTGNNFRLEYDEDIPYTTKKIINGINKILDQKYGKLVKPEVSKITTIPNTFEYWQQDMNEDGGMDRFRIQVYKKDNKWFEEFFDTSGQSESVREITYNEVKLKFDEALASNSTLTRNKGIQPTQTNETLKEKINDVAFRVADLYEEGDTSGGDNPFLAPMGSPEFKQKEYTSQALINTKIAKLKEVAKKYPRSLIRSEVKRINTSSSQELYNQFGADEFPFQKIPNNIEKNIIFVKQEDLNKLEKGDKC